MLLVNDMLYANHLIKDECNQLIERVIAIMKCINQIERDTQHPMGQIA